MASYILLITVLLLFLPIFTLIVNPKLKKYVKELYKIKPKPKKYKAKFFTFLPDKKPNAKPFYIKLIYTSFVTSIIFFVSFIVNYQEPDIYYNSQNIQELTFEKLAELDPFKNANSLIMILMYLSLIYSLFVNIICSALLFENFLAISIYKIITLFFSLIKKTTIFIYSKSIYLFKKFKKPNNNSSITTA